MSCPKTESLLLEYFDEALSPVARTEVEQHLQGCQDCARELDRLRAVESHLAAWQVEEVPHWDRRAALIADPQAASHDRLLTGVWRWFPTAASFAMLLLLVFNVEIHADAGGLRVAFGASRPAGFESALDQRLASMENRFEGRLQSTAASLEDSMNSSNLNLTETVMAQVRQTGVENFEQLYSYFEQQRQLDMELLEASYQALVDSDMETLVAMEQLASFVQYSAN